MRLVIQRVNKADVSVSGKTVGKIEKGLFVLVGVKKGDTKSKAGKLANKLFKLRIMADTEGKMNLSVKDVDGKMLIVSQFTLYADTKKGNRPSFIKAADPEVANDIYEHFVKKLKELGVNVQTGEFGSYMKINALLDGPVTIITDD